MYSFTFGRVEGFPSQYSAKHWPVTIDVTETIFIALFIIIGIAYFCIIPGYSKRRSIYVIVKSVFSISIGCLLIVENFGQEWEVGSVKTRTSYRAGSKHEIKSVIGLKIGLRSVNITLKGLGEPGTPLEKETINYNERFPWTWDQGRFGFGPYAGLFQRSYRDAQRRGLPIPILWVAEYFTIDGEGIRFGRFYRTAGWYCHVLLWTAFACWILANIFLQTVGRYAAYLIGTAGLLQLLSCVLWIVVHNPTPLVIPFEDGVIRVHLGLHFWMTLACGIFCLILALMISYMDLRYPNALSTFLGIDPLDQYDEVVMRYSELEDMMQNKIVDMEMNVIPERSRSSMNSGMVVLKRRSSIKNAQKSLFRQPIPVTIDSNDQAIYENQAVVGSTGMEGPSRREPKDSYRPAVPRKIKGLRVGPGLQAASYAKMPNEFA